MNLLLCLALTIIALSAIAQPDTKEQLAFQYFNNGEFEKSLLLFEELFYENPSSDYYYKYYLECLLFVKDFKQSEILIKKQLKKHPDFPTYIVDLGYLYSLTGDFKKKSKLYADAINSLKNDPKYISLLANAFIQRKEIDYAIEVYRKGRLLNGNPIAFSYQLAELYNKSGQTKLMIDEYLKLLDNDETQIEIIQNNLQEEVLNDSTYILVKDALISEVQKSDYNPVMIDLLVWLFVQKKDFISAFIQVKALDKRLNDNNTRLIQLAQICLSNKDYYVVEQIYQYIIGKGEATPYYYHAKFGLIDVKYLKIVSQGSQSPEELIDIEQLYTEFLTYNFYRFPDISEKVILRLAEVKAIYLNKADEAISLLGKYMIMPQISRNSQALMKLALADYNVLKGNVWDAILLYLQVDNMFKDHPIGHQARYRNARLSFFMGDFEWAADQLEVLKGSTSELISNDALRLSLLIQDVLGFDSNEVPLKMYARADFFLFKNKLDSANIVLDSLLTAYSNHPLEDDAWFAKAQIAEKKLDYHTAIQFYSNIITNYKDGILADIALFYSSLIYEEKLNDAEKAKELYQKIILEYPDSIYTIDARKRFRALRGEKGI